MTVLFGTLGWRPQSLVPTIRSTENLERVQFYHSDHVKSRDARSKVIEFCRSLGVPASAAEVTDAYDLLQVASQIRGDVRKERAAGAELRFNIAGGTRLMSSAALLVCILEGIPTTYVHDETNEEIQLPLFRMNYADHLSAKQKEILAYLVAHRDRPPNETSLAKALGVHKSTMNHHVKQLVAKGVAEVAPDPKDTRAHLIRAAPGAELLVG